MAWIIEILHQIQYAVKQGCVRMRNALKCTLEGVFTVMERRNADQKAAETTIMHLMLTVGVRLSPGHSRKHNACRAETGGCVSGYISRVK